MKHFINREPLAQSVEHLTFNQRVAGSNPAWLTISAGVAELADAPDLGSGAFGRGGSTPFTRTINYQLKNKIIVAIIYNVLKRCGRGGMADALG